MATQDSMFKNDIMMSLGSSNRPPVLINESEFPQWRDRFINFLDCQSNRVNLLKSLLEGPFQMPYMDIPATATTPAARVRKELGDLTPEEDLRHQADRDIKSYLILSLPNFIYNRIDCYKNNITQMWAQLEKIMLGSEVSSQLRRTRYMNSFESFKAEEKESLKATFDRFLGIINNLYKIKIEKSELEVNLKFINSLQPEWNKTAHRLRNDVGISTMQIQELYERLMVDEDLVKAKKAKIEKKVQGKKEDPIALMVKQLAEKKMLEEVFDGSVEDDGEELEKAMILLSQHFQKKYRSGNNNLRFTSGSRKVNSDTPPHVPKQDPPKKYTPKADEEKKPNITCFRCGKPGHIAKECQTKIVKNASYYKKKFELADKKEQGKALLVEEDYFLDFTDDESDTVETAAMCFVGDDVSDEEEKEEEDSSTDESEIGL